VAVSHAVEVQRVHGEQRNGAEFLVIYLACPFGATFWTSKGSETIIVKIFLLDRLGYNDLIKLLNLEVSISKM